MDSLFAVVSLMHTITLNLLATGELKLQKQIKNIKKNKMYFCGMKI